MSWSASQLRMLRAMGHEPMAWQDPLAAARTPAIQGAATSASVPPPGLAATPFTAATSGAPKFAALLQALRRAAGDRDVSTLAPDLERLRCDPALKRALWPALRALRRSH